MNPSLLSEKTDWISVKDKLPEEGVNVLVFEDNYISIGQRLRGFELKSLNEVYERSFPKHTFDSGNWTGPSTTITHWMPLPEPPKLERVEDAGITYRINTDFKTKD